MHSKVLFIGGGNMAASLIGGLLADGHDAATLDVIEPVQERRDWLKSQFGIDCLDAGCAPDANFDMVVLAVKPQVIAQVAAQWKSFIQQSRPVILSIAAGIRTDDLSRWLGGYRAIVRAMPNTPALIQAGATGLYACPEVDDKGRERAEGILRAVGLTLWVEKETMLDAITALSGSGPAYFFYFMEALQAAGVSLGLDERSARLLTLQTALGAARMALESADDVALLRERVTSPGGTTEQALEQLRSDGLEDIVQRAVSAAAQRAAALGDELSKDDPAPDRAGPDRR